MPGYAGSAGNGQGVADPRSGVASRRDIGEPGANIPHPIRGDVMKITDTRTELVELPADEPLAGAAENPNGKRPIVTLRIATDDGAEGIGVAYFGGALTRTLRHAIDELGALCVGEDPQRVEAVQQKLKNAAGGSAAPGGVYHRALEAVDRALLDLRPW